MAYCGGQGMPHRAILISVPPAARRTGRRPVGEDAGERRHVADIVVHRPHRGSGVVTSDVARRHDRQLMVRCLLPPHRRVIGRATVFQDLPTS